MIRYMLASLPGIVALALAAPGAEPGRGAQQDPKLARLAEVFEARQYKDAAGRVLPYRIAGPARRETGQKYPLLVFLHGAGERGDDNLRQLMHCAAELAAPEVRQKYPCYLVFPQCPKDGWWSSFKRDENNRMAESPGDALRLTMELIQSLLRELGDVDADRVYIGGLSMGGFGTWELLSRRPEWFAAGIAICGGGDPKQAASIAKVPVWAFHGDRDNVVKPEQSVVMVEAVKKAGGNAQLTIYPGVGHNSWEYVFKDPKVLQWLFEQRRNSAKGG